MNRTTLLSVYGKDASKRVTEKVALLETAYLKKNQRKLPPEVLFLSPKDGGYDIVAHYNTEQQAIVDFLQQNIERTP